MTITEKIESIKKSIETMDYPALCEAHRYCKSVASYDSAILAGVFQLWEEIRKRGLKIFFSQCKELVNIQFTYNNCTEDLIEQHFIIPRKSTSISATRHQALGGGRTTKVFEYFQIPKNAFIAGVKNNNGFSKSTVTILGVKMVFEEAMPDPKILLDCLL